MPAIIEPPTPSEPPQPIAPGQWRYSAAARSMRNWIKWLAIAWGATFGLTVMTLGLALPLLILAGLICWPAIIVLGIIYAVKRDE